MSPPKTFCVGAAELDGVDGGDGTKNLSEGLFGLARLAERGSILIDDGAKGRGREGCAGAAQRCCSGRLDAVQLRIYFEDALMLLRESGYCRS